MDSLCSVPGQLLYMGKIEYMWTHGQRKIARLNGQGPRMRAISVLVCAVTQP